MKKVICVCSIFIILLVGCGNVVNEDATDSTIVVESSEAETTQTDENSNNNADTSTEQDNTEASEQLQNVEIPPVHVDPVRPATWADGLNALGEIKVDADGDGTEDTISIVYADKEGGLYLSKLEVALSTGNHYVLSEEEAIYRNRFGSLKQIEVVDVNQDGAKELVCLLDAHSSGGRGMCEILVLWMDQSEITATLLGVEEPQIQGVDKEALFANSETEVDGVYFCQKVLYEGKEYLLTRQYAWSGSHSGHVGDVVCITSLNRDEKTLDAEVAWIEPESYFPW